MIHVYAITDRSGPVPDLTGIDGAAVEVVTGTRAAAAISEHATPPQPTAESVWHHELVVEAVMADRAVLPARFGRGLATRAELETQLDDERQPALLDRVRDAVELAVRVVTTAEAAPAEPATPKASSGRDHLQRLAEQRSATSSERAAAERAGKRVSARLASVADAVAVRPSPPGRVVLHAAFLVPRSRQPAFEALVGELAAELEAEAPAAALLCTGPWPPYSFVSDDGAWAARQLEVGA